MSVVRVRMRDIVRKLLSIDIPHDATWFCACIEEDGKTSIRCLSAKAEYPDIVIEVPCQTVQQK